MSLRFRLVSLILALVASVAITLSALQLRTLVDSLSAAAVERAELAGRQVNSFLIDRISLRSEDYTPPSQAPAAGQTPAETALQAATAGKAAPSPAAPPPSNVDTTPLQRTRSMWFDIVSNDTEIQQFLQRTMAASNTLIEINVADDSGRILASSSPTSVGMLLEPRESFSSWRMLPWYRRAYDLVTRRPDWQISPRPIGIAGQAEALLQIQIVTSSVLVRESLLPQIQQLAEVSAGALLVSLILTLLVTQGVLRPLRRIERTIDRIAQGNFSAEKASGPLDKEFRAVESKLNLLGQQFQVRQQDALSPASPKTLEGMVEHVASQLDVATRLAAISRLSGGVAHEIKNPLNAILLRLDLLKARLGDTDEETSQEFEVLSREVLRLDRVVKTFLDFSRPLEVHFEQVDLAALLREVTGLVQPQAAAANIRLECAVRDPGCFMRGDPDLLRQAVLNLLTNALEAMAHSGGRLLVTLHREDGRLVLEVADNGPGIPENMRSKVFQLYFTSKAKGSGIGLAMTYRAVQLHNGTISFSSVDEKDAARQGTTFHLEFPATEQHV